MGTHDGGRNTVKAAETLFRIVEALYERDGAGVTELASDLGVSKSTAHRHLLTLLRNEYAVKDGDTYYLSFRFLELGDYVRNREELYRLAKPLVEELAEETEERAQFVVEEHGYIRYVHRATGSHAVETDSGLGKRAYMHAVAAGKAILAEFQEPRAREIVRRRGLPALTENTITDETALFEELAAIEDRGVSFNDEESIVGLRAVGVPICGPDGVVMGALTVAGPTHRLKGDWFETDIPDLLLGTANELELKIAYP
ncbi:MAG: IclR family transcriptional regulator [Salinigranum sp.]